MDRIRAEFEVTVSDFRKANYYGMFLRYRTPLRIMFVVLGVAIIYGIAGYLGMGKVNYLVFFLAVAYLIWGLLMFAKTERQILVRVPNADGGNYTAIYAPVLMYQIPNYQNKYLYLFFLRDEKQDLSELLGLPAGTVQMPTYGELKMLLSQEYNSNPLETAE